MHTDNLALPLPAVLSPVVALFSQERPNVPVHHTRKLRTRPDRGFHPQGNPETAVRPVRSERREQQPAN